jgi:tetratricopeptide (TPR) repeat protein
LSKFFIWYLLARMTGSPIGSAVGLLVFWWVADRFTLGLLPDPFRFVTRWRKQWKLEGHLAMVPHDRKARMDLAELYLDRKQYAKAVDVLRPNLEAGDDDIVTAFTMGIACLGAGHVQQGEKLMAHVLEMQPDFRVAEAHLWLGRFRLARGDFKGARASFEQLISSRKGTVEGRVLLSRALKGLGDDGAAALMRDQAWEEYVGAPRFQRKRERLWAWRARPSRPIIYAVVVVAVLFVVTQMIVPGMSMPDPNQQ